MGFSSTSLDVRLPITVFLWTEWEVPLELAVGLAAMLLAYLIAIGPLRPPDVQGERVTAGRVAAFVGGVLTLFVALTGPLGDLAGIFFSAHMVQHLVLTVAIPPLLLLGTPRWLIRPVLLGPPVAALARFLTRPAIACSVFGVVLIAWHVPMLYNLSLADRSAHIAMHLMLIGSAVLGWWPLMSPLPELPRLALPRQMLYIPVLGLPMVVVGAFVTLSDSVLYPFYAAAPRLWTLSPLQDQRIGGLIMWLPGKLVFVIALTVVFFRWAWEESAESDVHPTADEGSGG